MANVSVFDISGGVTNIMTTSSVIAAAAEQTVPVGKDTRLALRVANTNAAAVTVRIKAGDGPRAPLGNNDVTVAAGSTAYIALYDTARYKTGNTVTVDLLDASKAALSAEALGGVKIEAVQL